MSVALIEPFDRWFLSLSKGSGTTRRNDCYTKCGGFDKLNHRNANLLDSPIITSIFRQQKFMNYGNIRHFVVFSGGGVPFLFLRHYAKKIGNQSGYGGGMYQKGCRMCITNPLFATDYDVLNYFFKPTMISLISSLLEKRSLLSFSGRQFALKLSFLPSSYSIVTETSFLVS